MSIIERGLVSRGLSQRGLIRRGLIDLPRICYAVDFNGTNQYGVLAERAVNIEGDNVFEFWSPANLTTADRNIIAQNISSTPATMEFRILSRLQGEISILHGGAATIVFTQGQGYKPATCYGLTLIGTEVKIYEGGLDGTLLHTSTFTRGTAREPTARTLIGCRGNGPGAFSQFFQGLQYDVKINGRTWVMGDKDQVIQPSIPAGNDMTLVNVTSDRWIEVPCRVPPT
jgi:hypothetical protein